MNIDPQGYEYLYNSLGGIEDQLRSLGRLKQADTIHHAAKFRNGSPTEFLGESRQALQTTLNEERDLPQQLIAEIHGLINAISEAFDHAGYK